MNATICFQMTLLPFDTYNVVVLISITWMHGMWISGLSGNNAGIQTDARDLQFRNLALIILMFLGLSLNFIYCVVRNHR